MEEKNKEINKIKREDGYEYYGSKGIYGDVGVIELGRDVWKLRWWVIIVTVIFSALSIIYSFSLPDLYKSEIILATSNSNQGNRRMLSQYSGLAELAGIKMESDKGGEVDQALIILESWSFLETFIKKYKLMPNVIAAKNWNKKGMRINYYNDIYNDETKSWLVEEKERTSWKAYEKMRNIISVDRDTDTGFIKLSVEHVSPVFSLNVVDDLKNEINKYFQDKAITVAKNNIIFLGRKINDTSVSEMRAIFYSLIEEQSKVLMLSNLDDEYLFKTVVPARMSEEKSAPNRMNICVAGAMAGFMLGLFTVVLYSMREKE